TEAVRDYLLGLKNWQGALGLVSFDEKGDVATSYAVKRVEDGVMNILEVVKP
ncbi:branched-chain amino acid ABC transporter substrate-binding protein, partial [Candidatus Uhrbacteria bacterium]|nr:branched-chain amino acid ABC transporter substrate-binding protein [Candidatus Uhrbacteria bacterium]